MRIPRFARWLLVILLTTVTAALAQPPDDPMATVKLIPTANDAYALLVEDLKANVKPELHQFTHYVWLPDGDLELAKCTSFIVNVLSASTTIVRPEGIGVNGLQMVRVTLPDYAPRERDLKRWTQFWEELQFDPALNRLVTKDTVKLLRGDKPKLEKKKVAKKAKAKSKTSKTKSKEATVIVETPEEVVAEQFILDGQATDIIRESCPSIDPKLVKEAVDMTGSQAPLVTYDYFERRVMTAVKDADDPNAVLYAKLYGGLYYEFAGIDKSDDPAQTDENLLFEQHLFIGNKVAKLTPEQVFEEARADQRFFMTRSEVTGTERLGAYSQFLRGYWWGTFDLRNRDIDYAARHSANLIRGGNDFAREYIFARANGLHGYSLNQGRAGDQPGARQDAVPQDVVGLDRNVPAPHSMLLQPAISCIGCHEADGSDGIKPFRNDAFRKFKATGPTLLGDISDAKRSIADTHDRGKGLYARNRDSGPANVAVVRARDDYAKAVLLATGVWKREDDPEASDPKNVVKTTAKKLYDRHVQHVYGMVTPQLALREIGVEVDEDKSVAVLNKLLPPDERAAVGEFVPEDVTIANLKDGIPVDRNAWNLSRSFAAERAMHQLAELRAAQPKGKDKEQPRKKTEKKQ